jgi:hypothetical protein
MTKRRLQRSLVFALLLAGAGCRRAPPAVTPPAEIVPLDPQAVRRAEEARASARHARSAPPPLRTLRYELSPRTPYADLEGLARALEARAAALDAVNPRATVEQGRIVLTLALPPATWRTLVADQLVRRGVLEIFLLDPFCTPFDRLAKLPEGIEFRQDWYPDFSLPVGYLLARADHARGIAPIAPLQALVASQPLPPGRRVLIGPVRDGHGDVARRTYCVQTRDALRAPRVTEVVATLHTRTLEPALRVHLGPPDDTRLETLAARAGGRPLVVAIDGEVIVAAPARLPLEEGWFQVVPQARVGSVSPEIVGALLRSGPLPTEVRLVAATP